MTNKLCQQIVLAPITPSKQQQQQQQQIEIHADLFIELDFFHLTDFF